MFWNSPKANQAEIIGNKAPIGIGNTVVNNWQVYDGPGENAKLVARAQGLHIYAGNWHNSFSLVFVDERFSGSTLEVMGIVVETGEWAIVGGTGQFAMANGVISKRTHKSTSDGNIIELTIRAFCPQLKGTRYPAVTKIGPWGGAVEGGQWTSKKHPSVWKASPFPLPGSWTPLHSPTSTSVARSAHTIQLAESEVITQVSGTVGTYDGHTVLGSITFVTNLNKTYGPWGNGKDAPFTIPVQPGSAIVGFFARAGAYLDAIGFHVRPL